MALKFSVFFPDTQNIDLGLHTTAIPYTFANMYQMDAELVTYEQGNYPNFQKFSDKLKISFIERTYKDDFLNYKQYLLKYAKSIDIIEFIHRDSVNYRLNRLYKRLNNRGKSYLKMDVGRGIISRLKQDRKNIFKELARRFYINKFDCISVESKEVYEFVKSYYGKVYGFKNLILIPNGYFVPDKFLNQAYTWAEKKKIMITIGRIGTRQKASEIFLESLGKIQNDISDWKIYFVGSIKESFKETINIFFERYPGLKQQIVFTGVINDKEKLYDLLKKSRIFCFTSRWEGFPNAPLEAGFFRNYIISTPTAGVLDILDQGRLGDLFDFDNSDQLAALIKKAIHNDEFIKEKSFLQRQWVIDNFNWSRICATLYETLFGHDKGWSAPYI